MTGQAAMFTPWLVHSDFSPGIGSSTVESLVERAARNRFPAVALSDVENLRGQVRFHHAARAWGIKALSGVMLRSHGRRLLVIAKDLAGWGSLCALVTRRRIGRERSDEAWLGVDLTSAGLAFATDDEVLLERRLAPMHWLLGPGGAPHPWAPSLACPEIGMASQADAASHLLLCAIQSRARVREVSPGQPMPEPAQLETLFPREALEETVRLAEACSLDLTEARHAFSRASHDTFQLASRALSAPGIDPAKSRRVHDELEVIERLGFSSYFLLVAKVIDASRSLGIHVAARGSVVSSVVGHLLGFSPVDPIREGLLFERFLHDARTKPPDIDLDVPSERREELIAWTLRHLGPERAAMISTHVTFRRRSAYRAALAAYDLDPASLEAIRDWEEPPRLTGPLAELVPVIESIIGRFHHVSLHPGGLAIVADQLEDFTALERAPGRERVTQLDATALEAIGVLKLDLLGSRALSVIDEATRLAGFPSASVDDGPTLAALRVGDTLGCAQVESPAMRATLQGLPLATRSELTPALALVRPGPGSGSARVEYLARASSGVVPDKPLYDEDLIRLIHLTTGLPLDQADELRSRVIRGEETNFLELARLAGTPADQSQQAWRHVQRFSAYSFSKAHAASTAMQAWTAVQLKHEHPAAFACAVLNHYGGAYPLRTLVADFQRHGVEVLAPSVNASLPRCSLEGSGVRVGFSMVKFLEFDTVRRILAARPFERFEQLLAVRPSARELEALVMCGACDGLSPLEFDGYPFAHGEVLALVKQGRSSFELVPREARGAKGAMWRTLQRIKHELEYLDMHLVAHPLAVLRGDAEKVGCLPIAALSSRNGQRVRFAGLVAASLRHRTERGAGLQFVTFEDESGLVESTLRLSRPTDALSSPGPWLIEGRVHQRQRATRIEVIDARPFHQRAR